MVRLLFVTLALIIASCLAAPGERVKRHGFDYGNGGYGHGGGGGGGFGGHGGLGGHFGGVTFPLQQSFSQSKASASSSSNSGGIAG